VKSYYLPRFFRKRWQEARPVCQSYGMEILSLETAPEFDHFQNLCKRQANLFDWNIVVGGATLVGRSRHHWYWTNSGNHINYSMRFGPGEPNNVNNSEFCLSILKYSNDFLFNDMNCNDNRLFQFVCQKIDRV
jgi:Lectin C-type domain